MLRVMSILALAAAGMMGCQNAGVNSSVATGQANAPESYTPLANMSDLHGPTDQQFVNEAAAGGMYEVQEGRLAVSRGQSDRVRKIAERMVTDHTKANQELMGIAGRENLTVPAGPTAAQAEMISSLGNMSASDFDREYLKQQEAAHRETIALFEVEAKGGRDAVLRQFASNTLPTLREHLAMILGRPADISVGSER